MPNIAAALREEIMRLARKEIRAQSAAEKKLLRQLRSSNTVLRRETSALRSKLQKLEKRSGRVAVETAPAESGSKLRFQAKGLAKHRAKLGLSAADYGRLVGVTGQTIYKWEQDGARPRAAQLAELARVRDLGKRAAKLRLEQLIEKD